MRGPGGHHHQRGPIGIVSKKLPKIDRVLHQHEVLGNYCVIGFFRSVWPALRYMFDVGGPGSRYAALKLRHSDHGWYVFTRNVVSPAFQDELDRLRGQPRVVNPMLLPVVQAELDEAKCALELMRQQFVEFAGVQDWDELKDLLFVAPDSAEGDREE